MRPRNSHSDRKLSIQETVAFRVTSSNMSKRLAQSRQLPQSTGTLPLLTNLTRYWQPPPPDRSSRAFQLLRWHPAAPINTAGSPSTVKPTFSLSLLRQREQR